MSAVLAKPQVKDFLKTLAKGKEKGQEERKEHDVNVHAVTAEGEPSKKPWEEDIPEFSSPSYSPPTSFSYSSDSSSSSNPRRRSKKTKRNQPKKSHHSSKKKRHRHARKKKTFKAGDKDIKFEVYNGKRVTNKALAFIRQFEVAFAESHFSERSKLRHVSMYLKDTASDWFSKEAHFVPGRKKIKSEHTVKLFMHNIFKYHGMPQSIDSDRDPRMTSLFWKALFENMDTTLKFSSSFHPQTDGQSEEANSTVQDLLKCYVSEHKAAWERNLPLVEYAYNNTVHTSTGKASDSVRGEESPTHFAD
ncbi:hypothetical protein L7F22_015323 [Adiantum nelumboides]|nr:hypothetical protein [Adiantum nelumboides]